MGLFSVQVVDLFLVQFTIENDETLSSVCGAHSGAVPRGCVVSVVDLLRRMSLLQQRPGQLLLQ